MSEAGDKFATEHPGCFLWMLGALAAVIGYAVFFGGSDGETDEASDTGAIDVCHQAVEDQLKAPGTADFGGEEVGHSGHRYTVSGHVDAENGFGALLRLSWTCEATWVSDSEWNPVLALVDQD